MAKSNEVEAAKPERKPREKKPVIIQFWGESPADWKPVTDGAIAVSFADTAAAERYLSERGLAGRYRILTVQRELTVKKVEKVVLE